MTRKNVIVGTIGLIVLTLAVLFGTQQLATAKEPKPNDRDDTQPVIILRETHDEIDLHYEPEPQDAPLAPEITEHYEDIDGNPWEYFLYEARPEGTGQPLILSLHGSGESGTGLETLRYGGSLAKYVLDGSMEPDCIVLMPQCPSFGWDVTALRALLDHVVRETGANPAMLSVTGVSMGGFGTWDMLAEYPTLFRYAAPIASNATNLPALADCTTDVLALSGTADGYDGQGGADAVDNGRGKGTHVWVPEAGHSDMCNIYSNEEYNPVPFLLGEPAGDLRKDWETGSD